MAKEWTTFTRRTDMNIPHHRRGESFHAPILATRVDEAWAMYGIILGIQLLFEAITGVVDKPKPTPPPVIERSQEDPSESASPATPDNTSHESPDEACGG